MPFTNTTHTSTSQTDSHPVGPSGSVPSPSHVASNPIVGQTYVGELYYGMGRFLRNKWDYLYETFWKDSGASPEAIARKQRDIYVAGLKECIEHLKPAIENVRKNPHDPASLGKMDDLAQYYAAYVNVHPTMEWYLYQQEFFQPIRGQVEQFTNSSLKRKLKMLLPVLTMDSSKQENKKIGSSIKKDESVQTDEYDLALSQSYYYEENYVKRAVMQQFPASFDLNSLDGNNGFSVSGVVTNGSLGDSVSSAGDINGDGISDLVLGASAAYSGGGGASYIIFGSQETFSPSFNLASFSGANGFAVQGVGSNDNLGISVSAAGDINGDGISDLLLGALFVNSGTGASYVIFGTKVGFRASLNLTNLNGTNGFTIMGIPGGYLGRSVNTAGDLNGDGVSDLVLGANEVNNSTGACYVIFGSRFGFNPFFNLTNLNGTNGFTALGIGQNGYLGTSVNTAGDINGDGISDLRLGAPYLNSDVGADYIIFGNRLGFPPAFDLTNLNGANGFRVLGEMAPSYLGYSGGIAGDVNGDGINDLVLGAQSVNVGVGASYVIFGNRFGFPPAFNLTNLNGTNGFIVPGVASGGLGYSVSTAGDMNGDGISDLVLGAYNANSGAGASYVIFGSREGFASSFNLNNLNGINGFVVQGIAPGGHLGWSVSTAGDINGDGVDDLVLGANRANSGAGASYVIFGKNTVAVPCPNGQPFMMRNNDIQMSEGQNLRLTPNDLSTSCGNSTFPNLDTVFQITGIRDAQIEVRNINGIWKTAFSFFGNDLARGNVALLHDNSTNIPAFNFTVRDGQTKLPETAANIQFSTVNNVPQVNNITFDVQFDGTTLLNPEQFQITEVGGKLSNLVVSVESIEGGYFSLVTEPEKPIFEFTYYQVQTKQIQFVQNGTTLPNITFGIGDGSSQPVPFRPLISFFDTNNPATPSVPIAAVVGSTMGALAAIGLGVFGIFKYRQHQEQEENVAQSAGQRLR